MSGNDTISLLKPPHQFNACFMDREMSVEVFENSVKRHIPILAMTEDVIQAPREKTTSLLEIGFVHMNSTMAKDQRISEADKMLDICIYDYFVKRKLHATAEAFMKEAKVSTDQTEIDAPGYFLYGWWTAFWVKFEARMRNKHSESASAYTETQQMKAREEQLQMQPLQLRQQRSAQSQQRDSNHPALSGSFNAMNSEGMMGLPPAIVLAMKAHEERMKRSNSMYSEASPTLFGASRMALSNFATSRQGFSQSVHGKSGNISTLQQIQQHYLPLAQTDPTDYHDMDPHILSGLGGGSLSAKDDQSAKNGRSICTQVQSGSTENNRKRKQHSSSRAAKTIVAQIKHTPSDGIITASSLQHVSDVQKSAEMVYGIEGIEGLSSPSISLENMEQLADVGNLDFDLESYLLNNIEDGDNLNGIIKQSQPAEQQKETPEDFTFAEFGCIRTSKSKVTCCHFSSDGKFLASAGHDKKAVLWNMDTLKIESTPEEHKSAILDVRFKPNSSQLATASTDKSVRLWDATNPSYCVQEYSGHNSAVMSLDFHPVKTDLFCFSDSENEIRYWNMTTSSFTSVLKGGNAQVRFQPGVGELLAAAYDKGVSIFNVETGRQIYSFQGHPEVVSCICWGANGDVLASVSHNFVKFWSLSSGECIKGLNSCGEQYHSCVFHPSYSTLLVIGGTSCFEIWDIAEDKSMTIPADQNIISSLVQSPVTGIVASASHDCTVKLWK